MRPFGEVVCSPFFQPCKVRLKLFFHWGIQFGEPYTAPERGNRKVAYANKVELVEAILANARPLLRQSSRRGRAMAIRHGGKRQWVRNPASRKGVRSEWDRRAVAVYIYLAGRANKDNTCWPAIPTTAQDIKYSEFTVRRAMKNLRKAGLLEPEQRYRGNGGKSLPLFDYHVFNMLLL